MPIPCAFMAEVVRRAARGLPSAPKGAVSVMLASSANLRALNRKYRGVNHATDVLSFTSSAEGELGDIVISVPQARRQAETVGHSLNHEISILLVHGFLHLLGYDHETAKDARRMIPLQEKIAYSILRNLKS